MSKFCIKCGQALKDVDIFCSHCGAGQQPSAQARQDGQQYAPSQYTPLQTPKKTVRHKTAKRRVGGMIAIIASGLAVIMLFIFVGGPMISNIANSAGNSIVRIDDVTGQPYAGRAVTISGEGFGYYDTENSRVTIDGKDTPIISWSEKEVTVIVPSGITAGQKEVVLSNPLTFDKKSVKTEFLEHKKTELKSVTLFPSEDNRIEGDGFTLIVPVGSVAEQQEIIISKYDAPSVDDSPYYTVTDEYEITGPDGEHIFFDQPVFFSLDVEDEEEALQTSYQIFDEYEGIWAKAETVYVEEEGKLYLKTNHFCDFRRFVSVMYKGAKKLANEKIDSAKKTVKYVYEKAKSAKDTIVELTEEAYVAIKDETTEDFIGISTLDRNFIIYYRVSDAKNDPSISNTSREMAAAFSTAYKEYKKLFGEENMPPNKRDVYVHWKEAMVTVPDPITVYIDPRYNSDGAVTKSATTGNIIMPSKFPKGNLASTCAHELFHAVQYKQLGLKQLYMGTTNLKDVVDNHYTWNDTEVYRLFANNKWFIEATAEFAGRFIGTNEGIGAPIHERIDASSPYYACNGVHEYGVSSFLYYILAIQQPDYILAIQQPDVDKLADAFKEMWNTVTGNYSVSTDINSSLNNYLDGKLGSSTQTLYEDFWREAFTRSYMPEVKNQKKNINIAGGLVDVNTLKALKKSSSMKIREDGVGIFRYNFEPKYMLYDETALTRSFWFEASPASMIGEVYRLDSLDMTDRVPGEPPYKGSVNKSESVKDVLVPYSVGDSFALVSIFKSRPADDAAIQVTIASTAVSWDNQEDIEKMVSNATLKSSDKLKFTPTLPEQKSGDAPFTAVVTLNDSEDFKTEIDKVENGKSFEVNAPMKELPPDKISVNIKIYKDGKLVHDYQSGEMKADAKVFINGPSDMVFEVTKEELPFKHTFTATAWPAGDYLFAWGLGNGKKDETTGKETSSVSTEYSEFGEYKISVTLNDIKGNKLASYEVTLTLKEKEASEEPAFSSEPTASSAVPETEKQYAWVLTDIIDFEYADRWATADAHTAYAVSHGYSQGSYSASTTYEGTDPYGQGLSGTLGLKAVFTGMPQIIYPDQPVSLNLSFTTTENSVVFLSFTGIAHADFDQWDLGAGGITNGSTSFVNKDGKASFKIDANGNPSSYSETLTAQLEAGSKGSRIALRTKFGMAASMGTNYVYEWKQVGESAPLLDTEGIEGIVPID